MFDRFAIVGAYYLYMSKFDYAGIPRRHLRSRALQSFRPGLSLNRATAESGRRYTYGQALIKADDYAETRDAYARLLRRARAALFNQRAYKVSLYRAEELARTVYVDSAEAAIATAYDFVSGNPFRAAHIIKPGTLHGIYIARHTDEDQLERADIIDKLKGWPFAKTQDEYIQLFRAHPVLGRYAR